MSVAKFDKGRFSSKVAARSQKLISGNRKQRRDELVKSVVRGLDIAGDALQELKDDEHWKDTGHTNFSAFCKDNFGISKTKLYLILQGMEVIASLPKELQPKITSDSQIAVLAKLPKDKRKAVVIKAENNGGITAENLALHAAKPAKKPKTEKSRIRDSSTPQPEPVTEEKPKTPVKEKEKVELDKLQTPIPLDALPYWKMRDEVQDFLSRLSKVRSDFKEKAKGDHPLYTRVYQNFLDYLSRAYHVMSDCKPYTVCTRCMGSPSLQPDGCSFCASTGVISQIRWKNNSDPRVKQLRLLSNAEYAKKNNLPTPSEEPEESEE